MRRLRAWFRRLDEPRRIRVEGCYVIKSAESRPIRIEELKRRAAGRPLPPPRVPTDADRALVRAIREAHHPGHEREDV
jgi:hypothetical protein